MRVTPPMIVTALVKTGTGLLLLLWPALVFALPFDWRQAAPETLLIGRVAGAAVISIGVAGWPARHDTRTPAQLGVIAGLLIYNVLAAPPRTATRTHNPLRRMERWSMRLLPLLAVIGLVLLQGGAHAMTW